MFSEMENVILTPHVGGITEESRERVVSCVCKDVAAVLQGERPIHAVNSIRF
jgi:phosphoglycerate dehydrogenase-like enzyme